MTDGRIERLRRAVLRHSHRGLDLVGFRTVLDESLRSVLHYDVVAWSTVDPATLLFTSCVVVGLNYGKENESKLFDLEFAVADVNKFVVLAVSDPPVATLSAATEGDLSRSTRRVQLLRPLGVVDELRAAFLDAGSCWGTLIAYRVRGDPFALDDVALVASVGPLIVDGLRRCLVAAAAEAPEALRDPPGVLVIDADGAVAETSPQAERWLAELAAPGQLPSVVRAVAAAARATAHGDAASPAQARVPLQSGGWLVLHGMLLKNAVGDRVAIVVEPARQAVLADVVVRTYGLTPRERQATELVLQGRSTREIARALAISTHTVNDHLKAVLAKVDVPSRRDLVATIYGRHYAPRTDAGDTPSPYGGYLDARC